MKSHLAQQLQLVTILLSLWQSIITLQDPSVFCMVQTGKLDGDAVRINIWTPTSFIVALISGILLFCITDFQGRSSSSNFQLVFPSIMDRTAVVKILPVIEYVYYNYTLGNWRNNHKKVLETQWVHCEIDMS
jgi:hypothetical protein